jgi:hypothetical protein
MTNVYTTKNEPVSQKEKQKWNEVDIIWMNV